MQNRASQIMTGRQIRAELILRGITQAEIAKQAGVCRQAVHAAVVGKYPYKGYRLRPIIASALGRKVEDIWPQG